MKKLTLTAITSVFVLCLIAGSMGSAFATSGATSVQKKADSLFPENTTVPGEEGLPVTKVAGEKDDQDIQLSEAETEIRKTDNSALVQDQPEKTAVDEKVSTGE